MHFTKTGLHIGRFEEGLVKMDIQAEKIMPDAIGFPAWQSRPSHRQQFDGGR